MCRAVFLHLQGFLDAEGRCEQLCVCVYLVHTWLFMEHICVQGCSAQV